MLSKKQLLELKEHLEKAQNPIFYYDNDCDGLCSFLMIRRFLGRGKGVAVRSFPDLNRDYARKAKELNADYVFILDKPIVSREFIEEINKLNLPIVWIDHHLIDSALDKEFNNISVFNPLRNKGDEKSEEPVTYLVYSALKRKEDLWLAIIGCIADHFMPDFSDEFMKQYPEFWGNVKAPFDAYYNTEIGRIAQSFNFGLKDSTTNIVRLQNFLIGCTGPNEVLAETTGNYYFRKKNNEIRKKYNSLFEKAQENVFGQAIIFEYGGDLSISADLANELCYRNSEKYVAVIYKNGGICNVSLRGKNVRDLLEKIIRNLPSASGGGHPDAAGARIKIEDLEKFKKLLIEGISENERSED